MSAGTTERMKVGTSHFFAVGELFLSLKLLSYSYNERYPTQSVGLLSKIVFKLSSLSLFLTNHK